MAKKTTCKIQGCERKRFQLRTLCLFHIRERERTKKAEREAKKKAHRLNSKKYEKDRKKILKKKLWELCKKITRLTYGWHTCYTCGDRIEYPKDAHTAHFIPSSVCGLYLRYDLRNLRVCCYDCNINLGGNGSAYYRKLVQDHGQEYVDELFRDKERITQESVAWYEEKIADYSSKLSRLTD